MSHTLVRYRMPDGPTATIALPRRSRPIDATISDGHLYLIVAVPDRLANEPDEDEPTTVELVKCGDTIHGLNHPDDLIAKLAYPDGEPIYVIATQVGLEGLVRAFGF